MVFVLFFESELLLLVLTLSFDLSFSLSAHKNQSVKNRLRVNELKTTTRRKKKKTDLWHRGKGNFPKQHLVSKTNLDFVSTF